MPTAEVLSKREFLAELEAFAFEQRRLIETECEGFDTSEQASMVRRAKAFDNYRFFVETYFPHYITSEPSVFHTYVFTELPAKIDSPKGHLEALAAPRGEAKSTLLTQLFTLWVIVTQRKHFPVIIMDSFDQSAMMLEAIKAELDSNPRLAQDFPAACGAGRVWQAGVIVTRNNIKVQVAGSGKKVRGWRHGPHRPDLVLLDDIENDENVRKKEQRDKTEGWIKKAVLKMGPPDGSLDVIYLGTILHYDSVLSRIMRSPVWRSKRFQAIIEWPDRLDLWERWEEILINEGQDAALLFFKAREQEMLRGAVVSWPSTRGLYALMLMRADGHHEFDCEMQNDPGADEAAPFKFIQFWVHPCRDWVFYGSVDPSLGKRNKSRDPSAILVGGFDRNHSVLDVVEATVARQVPDKIIQDTIAFQREYQCMAWVVEAVQFQEFFREQMVKESAKLGVPVPARGVIPSTDKNLRIESLQPHVANGLIRLHRNQKVLYEQLRYWPEADHDDGPDALQMLWMAALSGAGGVPQILTRASNAQRVLRSF